MPSIRETLHEMGVSPAQLFAELAQKSKDDLSPSNGTAPTPLTNYLDVRDTALTTHTVDAIDMETLCSK